MKKYIDLITSAYQGYAGWLWNEITHPAWNNFFYWVIGLSLFFFILELIRPWRKDQPKFRKDFWMDLFYVFFNFFIFSLVFWQAAQTVLVNLFNDFLALFNVENIVMVQMEKLPMWAYYLILFVVADFISWNVHRLLHRVPFLWQYHKVHHSVEQMGFAAHVRYHWMENVVYWSFRYIPLTMLGADLVDIFGIHILNTAWGHFNHANITVHPRVTGGILGVIVGVAIAAVYGTDPMSFLLYGLAGLGIGTIILGPFMRYLFNSPEMHIWHHAAHLPKGVKYGINYGITLAIWDYLFGTARIPYDGRDIELGFPGVERYPHRFFNQVVYGFGLTAAEKEARDRKKIMQGDGDPL